MPSEEGAVRSLAPQEYWDRGYAGHVFSRPSPDDPIREWLTAHVRKAAGTCFEIGCFPGRYLTVLGDLGYELNGVDMTPRVTSDLPEWLRSCGYRVGEFVRGDFLELPVDRTFDVVGSFGFIEHFDDWGSVLRRHVPFVAEDGLLVLEAPNFAGSVQLELRRALDAENLSRHNVDSMHPELWEDVLRDEGMTILVSGYIGHFEFWTEATSFTLEQRRLLASIEANTSMLRERGVDRDVSPYCGVVACKGAGGTRGKRS